MGLRNQSLFDKGDVCSIYEETLSDGSHVYNVRVYDSRKDWDKADYVEVEARDDKHAIRIFEVLNNFQHTTSKVKS